MKQKWKHDLFETFSKIKSNLSKLSKQFLKFFIKKSKKSKTNSNFSSDRPWLTVACMSESYLFGPGMPVLSSHRLETVCLCCGFVASQLDQLAGDTCLLFIGLIRASTCLSSIFLICSCVFPWFSSFSPRFPWLNFRKPRPWPKFMCSLLKSSSVRSKFNTRYFNTR